MLTIIITLILMLIKSGFQINSSDSKAAESMVWNTSPSNEECERRIYRECNYPTNFSAEELETVRQFFNYTFTQLADIKPDKPLCPQIYVRQNWKCLTQHQRNRIINVWQQMYDLKLVQYLADIHLRYWPAWHMTAEFYPAHRWIFNQFEKYMRQIDPNVRLPYWDLWSVATQPERSSIWDTLGHSGNYDNGYEVPDGIYPEFNLLPTIKRHWSPQNTVCPWVTHDFNPNLIQKASSYGDMNERAFGQHFMPHLCIGGYEGQYSIPYAPYDCLFYMHHQSIIDVHILRWQLSKREFYTPLSYDVIAWKFNRTNDNLEKASLATDYLTGVPDVTIRELFWIGFGDLCSIPDQMVRPIVNLMNGKSDPIPTAVKRMPKWILKKYFPSFLNGNYSGLLHTFEEVGDCNRECLPIPKPTFQRETENGRRQARAFAYDAGQDQTALLELAESYIYNFWLDLNRSGYCSPYVTSYRH